MLTGRSRVDARQRRLELVAEGHRHLIAEVARERERPAGLHRRIEGEIGHRLIDRARRPAELRENRLLRVGADPRFIDLPPLMVSAVDVIELEAKGSW